MASLEVLLGVGAAVLLVGVFAVRASVHLGLPSLLLYLAIGILLGESVLGIQFSDAPLTESIGLAALVLILTEGGITTRWVEVRPALGLGIALATVAVAVSLAVVGVALHLLLGLDWRAAFLWGAVLSSTVAGEVGTAEVVVSHHVLHNVVDLPPFLLALTAAAHCGVVVEMMAQHPMAWLDPLWARFHGLHRPPSATTDDAELLSV